MTNVVIDTDYEKHVGKGMAAYFGTYRGAGIGSGVILRFKIALFHEDGHEMIVGYNNDFKEAQRICEAWVGKGLVSDTLQKEAQS